LQVQALCRAPLRGRFVLSPIRLDEDLTLEFHSVDVISCVVAAASKKDECRTLSGDKRCEAICIRDQYAFWPAVHWLLLSPELVAAKLPLHPHVIALNPLTG